MKTVLLASLTLVLVGVLHAQTPAPPQTPAPAVRQAPADTRLPVRRVVLYKSGVGYFEHLGRVRGNQTVTVDFTSGQLDDVLKSLTTLDLDGGRVLGVSYNSEASLERRLSALRLPVGQDTSRAEFLRALRGARLDVRTGATRVTGRLLSVEKISRSVGNTTTQVDAVSLVTDTGEIQTVALDPGVSVRILEGDLNQEVGRYLSLVASVRDQDVRQLSIATTGTGDRDLFVSYISEVPVWKATYRLVLPTAATPRKPLLQGWAIIDNTVGEDWNNVELSLVAGAPQSFVQAISQPYYVQRPVVALPERMSLSPQTHGSALGTMGVGVIAGTVTDSTGGTIPGATVRATKAGARVAEVVTNGEGRYRITGLGSGSYDIEVSLPGFRTASYAGVAVSGGMESVMNVRLEVGGVEETMTVSAVRAMPPPPPASPVARGAGGGGRGGGFAGNVAERVDTARAEQQAAATAAELGDLFEYKLKTPVTIRKNQSALVPILSGDVEAEKVSLWNPESGSARPLRAVWLTNATGLTLDGGSFSVTEGQAFAGEGLMEPLKAGERRLLSYALDLGVQVDSKGESVPTRVMKVQINRGLVIHQTEERQRRTYVVRNDDGEPRVVIVEHAARAGWTVGGTVTPAETTAAWHRFRIPVAPKTTATFAVEDVRPGQTQYSVNSITDDQVAVLVRDQLITAPVEAALRRILAQKAEIARLNSAITTRQNEVTSLGRDQERVRENMKALKGTAEERALVQRYVKQLDDQENRLGVLRQEIQSATDERQKAQAELVRLIEALST